MAPLSAWDLAAMKLGTSEDHLHEKFRDPDYAVVYLEAASDAMLTMQANLLTLPISTDII